MASIFNHSERLGKLFSHCLFSTFLLTGLGVVVELGASLLPEQ